MATCFARAPEPRARADVKNNDVPSESTSVPRLTRLLRPTCPLGASVSSAKKRAAQFHRGRTAQVNYPWTNGEAVLTYEQWVTPVLILFDRRFTMFG